MFLLLTSILSLEYETVRLEIEEMCRFEWDTLREPGFYAIDGGRRKSGAFEIWLPFAKLHQKTS